MKMLTVDPGEDTGWSVWEDGKLIEAGTEKLWTFPHRVWEGVNVLQNTVPVSEENEIFCGVQRFVVEDFKIYPWKAKELGWDRVRTARLIGALTFIAAIQGIDFVLQPAKIKERAEAAGAEEFFLKPLHENRHANDAIRHGVYYLAVKDGVHPVVVEQPDETANPLDL